MTVETKFAGKLLGAALVCASLAAIIYPGSAPQAEPVSPPERVVNVAPKPLSATQLKGVIITDQTLLRKNFPLTETLDRILISTGDIKTTDSAATKKTKRETFLQTMLTSFKRKSATNNGVTMPMIPRPEEAAQKPASLLNPADPFEGMLPIAITNRLDLAPSDGRNCGEQRIVYAKGTGLQLDNRMTLIFEAVVPNPSPEKGIAGCLPLAKFWWNLRSVKLADMGPQLKGLFYTGIPGVTTGPIVTYKNYGTPHGQIRVNSFVVAQNRANPWILREFAVRKKADRAAYLGVRPVGNSPLPTLYQQAVAGENPKITQLRRDYQVFLMGKAMTDLLAIDIAAVKSTKTVTDHDFINHLGTTIPSRFNSFEDIVDSQTFEPGRLLTPALDRSIFEKIFSLKTAWPIHQLEFMGRVSVQSCAGCHEFQNGSPMQQSVNWPGSLGFVHIDETGRISDLLKDRFLPFRYKSMADFISSNGSAPFAKIPSPPSRESAQAADAFYMKVISPSLSENDTEVLVSQKRDAQDALTGAFIEHRPTH